MHCRVFLIMNYLFLCLCREEWVVQSRRELNFEKVHFSLQTIVSNRTNRTTLSAFLVYYSYGNLAIVVFPIKHISQTQKIKHWNAIRHEKVSKPNSKFIEHFELRVETIFPRPNLDFKRRIAIKSNNTRSLFTFLDLNLCTAFLNEFWEEITRQLKRTYIEKISDILLTEFFFRFVVKTIVDYRHVLIENKHNHKIHILGIFILQKSQAIGFCALHS